MYVHMHDCMVEATELGVTLHLWQMLNDKTLYADYMGYIVSSLRIVSNTNLNITTGSQNSNSKTNTRIRVHTYIQIYLANIKFMLNKV